MTPPKSSLNPFFSFLSAYPSTNKKGGARAHGQFHPRGRRRCLRQFANARHSVHGILDGVKGRLVGGFTPTRHAVFCRCRQSMFLREYPDVDLPLLRKVRRQFRPPA